MIVMKFGGTSVQNAEYIDKALDIAEKELNRSPLLVASAMGKVTDRLADLSELTVKGNKKAVLDAYNEIEDYHIQTVHKLLTGERLEKALSRINDLLQELYSLIKGLTLLKECTLRSEDALLSFGELLSTVLIAYRALERGIDTVLLDSRDFIRTDENFTGALPIISLTNKLIRKHINPTENRLYVTQGFIAKTESGATSTLGRGGSDYTATIIGAALDADEVQIWTDVNGILTSDPKIVKNARTVEKISCQEAAELAFFGAKVVHPSTIQPATEKEIPVLVKNTNDPEGNFTAILPKTHGKGIRAIAGKDSITLINITSSRMLNTYGFLSRIFAIFEKNRTPVDLIATSEVSVSMTIENTAFIDSIFNELKEIGDATVEENMAILCLVGKDLWKDSAFIARVFTSLIGIPIRMISLGSSRINLSLVVPEQMLNAGLNKLHNEFFQSPM